MKFTVKEKDKTCGGCVHSSEMPAGAEDLFYMKRWCEVKGRLIHLVFQKICDEWSDKWKTKEK